jgi:hypothetical protein
MLKRDFWDRFACKLKSVDEAPEPLRSTLIATVKPDEAMRLLLFGPAHKTFDKCSPATLLAVLDHEWVVVSGMEETPPSIARCDFADTLLVELTSILLFGKLRMDFAADGHAQEVTIHFNTVMERLYREAAEIVLNGMDGVSVIEPRASQELRAALESLPRKFCNAMLEFMPMGQRVLCVVHWPAVLGGRFKLFRHELAPEAVLALTERELLLITEEKTWPWVRSGRLSKYGSVVTHFPLSRVDSFELNADDQIATIDVEIRAGRIGKTFKIDFPREQETAVSDFMERVITDSAGHFPRTAGQRPGH